MNRSRITGNLTSHGILYSDIANDRVGIGSTIPGNKLSLPDSAKIGLGNAEDLTLHHTSGNNFIETDNGDIRIKTSDSSGNLTFTAGGSTERLRIHADGEVECKGGAAGQNALLVTGNYSSSGNVDIQTWQRIGGAVQAKMIYKDATTDLHFGSDTAHPFSIMTGGTSRIKIANNSAATSIGGALTFNAMLTTQGDISGGLLLLKATENTNRFFVTGNDSSGCEVNLYDDAGGQKGILGVSGSEFFIKAPNNSAPLTFYTHNGSSIGERLRIDSSGRLLQGLTTARANFGNNTSGVEVSRQLEGTSYVTSAMSIIRNSNDGNDGGIILGKTRAGSVGGSTVVQAGDYLGEIMWAGADGTSLLEGARIDAVVESGVGNDDMPTALRFLTNGGSTAPAERLRINSSGYVGVKRSTPLANLHTTNNELAIGANPTSAAAPNATYDGLVVDGEAGSFINIRSRGDGNDSYGRLAFSDNQRSRGYIEYRHKDGTGDDWLGLATAGSERFRINSNGIALFGTTTQAPWTNRRLTVSDTTSGGTCAIEIRSATNGSGRLYFTDGTSGGADSYAAKVWYDHAEDAMKFNTGGGSNTPDERLRITSAGLVGINQTAPAVELDIKATTPEIRLTCSNQGVGQGETIGQLGWYTTDPTTPTGAGTVSYINTYSATSNGSDYTTAFSNRAGAGGGETKITLGNALGQIRFYTHASGGGEERLRITSGGNVKIGGHSSGSSNGGEDKLNIKGDGAQYIYIGSNDASSAGIYLDGDSNGDMGGSDYARVAHLQDGYMQYDNWKSGGGHRFAIGGNTRIQMNENGEINFTGAVSGTLGYTFYNATGNSASDTRLLIRTYANYGADPYIKFDSGGSNMVVGQLYAGTTNNKLVLGTGESPSGGVSGIHIPGNGDTYITNHGYVTNSTSGSSAIFNVFKASGSDNDYARLRVGYDASNCLAISRKRSSASISIDANQSSATVHHSADGDDTMILTPRNSVHIAKLAPMVIKAPHVQGDATWGGSRPIRFVMRFSTGNFSASYHVARMITQHDWGFSDWEATLYHDYYSPATNTGGKHRYTGYYSSHTDQVKDYNQNSSGSGTGDSNSLSKNANLGPGGAHKIHESANGGYYRDAYATDYYVSLGVYSGITVEIKVNNPGGWLKDQGTTLSTIYPAAFNGQASQSDANSWSYGRGLWFNVRPGILDSSWWNHSSNFGQTTLPTS